MIKKLTKHQEDQIPAFLDKWLNMPTKPVDHKKAGEVIEKVYKLIGQKKPTIMLIYIAVL